MKCEVYMKMLRHELERCSAEAKTVDQARKVMLAALYLKQLDDTIDEHNGNLIIN